MKKVSILTFLGFVSLCLVGGVSSVTSASDIVLLDFKGQVEVRSVQMASWENVTSGTVLHLGDTIRTGRQSQAQIRFESGTISIYENTILELPTQPQHRRVGDEPADLKNVILLKGQSLFKIFKERLNGRFEVTTPSLIAGVKGTTFRVFEAEDRSGVVVSEGLVEVANRHFPEEVVEVASNHYTLFLDGHLMEAVEYQREEDLKSELREMRLDLKDQHRDFVRDLKDHRQELIHDLKNQTREVVTDLVAERKDMAADLQAEHSRARMDKKVK